MQGGVALAGIIYAMRTITLIGNVATGKSTVLPLMSEAVRGVAVDADAFFQVSPFRDDFLRSMSRWAFTNELWMTYQRSLLLSDKMLTDGNSLLVIDSGLPMSWVYTQSHVQEGFMEMREWDLYEQLFLSVSGAWLSETVIVELTAPIPLLMERIASRGRDYELALYNETYLVQLEKGLSQFRNRFQSSVAGWVICSEHDLEGITTQSPGKEQFISLFQQKLGLL